MIKVGMGWFAALGAVFGGLVVLVEALGYIAWQLTPTDEASLRQALAFEQQVMGIASSSDASLWQVSDVRKLVEAHDIAEWDHQKGRTFSEAPILAPVVEIGGLPPVSERLPQDPLVIVPPEQNGPYGGTWTRFGNGPQDVGILEARLAYDGLVRWDAMSREVIPNLAVRWEIGDGGRSYTFWLRKGVRWSDGHPCTVDDILFWYHRVLLNKTLTPVVSRDFKRDGRVMKVERIDDYTIRFQFQRPHGLFLYAMASGRSYEMLRYPAHYMKQYHPDFTPQDSLEAIAKEEGLDLWNRLFEDKRDWRNPKMPRLWPWLVVDPPPARPVVLERNPYYWKVDPDGNQLPYIDRMTFEIYDIETINLKAINGEIGMQGRHLQFTNYPLFMENRERGGYRVLHWVAGQGGNQVLLPNLNHKDPVIRALMEDHRFRKALSLAIDRDELNEVGFFGVGTPRQMSPPKMSDFYSREYARAYVDYDADEANRLLDAVGLIQRDSRNMRLRPDGRPLKLYLEVASVSGGPVLQLVADYWTRVGVDTEIKDMARQLWLQRAHGKLHDVTVWSGSDEQIPVLDPRWFFPDDFNAFHAPGYGRWFNSDGRVGEEPPEALKRCMDIFRQIEGTADRTEQVRLFREILELNRRHLWTIGMIGEVPSIFLVSNRFRNVPDVSVTGWSFRTPGNTAVECYAIEN